MAKNSPIIISTDEEAFALLKKAIEHRVDQDIQIEFVDWPTVTLRLTGDHYDGTITSGTAQALVEYQKALEHVYLRFAKPGSKRLTVEEKSKLAVTARVEKGSTIFTIDLNEALTNFGSQLVGKMSTVEILIAILGLGAIAGASVVTKAFLKDRATRLTKEKEFESQVRLSEQETKRIGIVADAMRQQPKLIYAQEEFDDARESMLRAAPDAKNIEFEGFTMTAPQAGALATQERTRSVDAQLNGVYTIIGVNWPEGDKVILELRSHDKELEFKATLNTESLVQRDRDLIAKAEWDRTPLYLSINAKYLRDQVVAAVIVGFDWEKLRTNR